MPLSRCFASGLMLIALLGGCDRKSGTATAPVPPAEATLTELGQLFQAFAQARKRPPKDMNELSSITPEPPSAIQAVQEGKITILWGGGYTTGTAGSTILAHEANAATSGGYVLFQDGTVKRLSAAEFQSAPKVK